MCHCIYLAVPTLRGGGGGGGGWGGGGGEGGKGEITV